MGDFPRKADGRRVFSTDFKRATVQRILMGEKTIAELSRELDISPGVIRNWKQHYEAGVTEVEILRAAQEVEKKRRPCPKSSDDDGPPDDGNLPGPRDRSADRVLRLTGAPRGPLSPGRKLSGCAVKWGALHLKLLLPTDTMGMIGIQVSCRKIRLDMAN